MKFMKLMKSEFAGQKKTKRFSWALDESKYLKLREARMLRNVCKKAREEGLKQGKIVPVRDWFLIELGLNTGLRVNEMRELKCGDLHIWEERSSVSVRKGKGGKPRVVHVNEGFKNNCKWFLKWKRRQGQSVKKGAYLFTNREGRQFSKRAL